MEKQKTWVKNNKMDNERNRKKVRLSGHSSSSARKPLHQIVKDEPEEKEETQLAQIDRFMEDLIISDANNQRRLDYAEEPEDDIVGLQTQIEHRMDWMDNKHDVDYKPFLTAVLRSQTETTIRLTAVGGAMLQGAVRESKAAKDPMLAAAYRSGLKICLFDLKSKMKTLDESAPLSFRRKLGVEEERCKDLALAIQGIQSLAEMSDMNGVIINIRREMAKIEAGISALYAFGTDCRRKWPTDEAIKMDESNLKFVEIIEEANNLAGLVQNEMKINMMDQIYPFDYTKETGREPKFEAKSQTEDDSEEDRPSLRVNPKYIVGIVSEDEDQRGHQRHRSQGTDRDFHPSRQERTDMHKRDRNDALYAAFRSQEDPLRFGRGGDREMGEVDRVTFVKNMPRMRREQEVAIVLLQKLRATIYARMECVLRRCRVQPGVAKAFEGDACSLPSISWPVIESVAQSAAAVAVAYLRTKQGREEFVALSPDLELKNSAAPNVDIMLAKRFLSECSTIKREVVRYKQGQSIERALCAHSRDERTRAKRTRVPAEIEGVFCQLCRDFFPNSVEITDVIYQEANRKDPMVLHLPEELRSEIITGQAEVPNAPAYPAIRPIPGPRDRVVTLGLTFLSTISVAIFSALSWI